MIVAIRGGMNVKRFHTTHRTQEETVGHHSSNVAAIVLHLDTNARRELLIAALLHDVPEVYTGDVPAPFKWDHPAIKQGLKDGEDAFVRELGLPQYELSTEETMLLKLADMTDLVLSSLEEMGRGNNSARELVANGMWYIQHMEVAEELKEKVNQLVKEVKKRWQLTTSK